MPVQQQNPDGSWSEAVPLGPQPGYDAEVHRDDVRGKRRWHWVLWRDGVNLVATGLTRTRLGASVRLVLAKRRDQAKRQRTATPDPQERP